MCRLRVKLGARDQVMQPKAIPIMLSMIPSVIRGVTPVGMVRIKQIVQASFPSVKQISAEELSEWMKEPESTLIIDVRSPKEFGQSHLRGAINLRSAREIEQAMRDKKVSQTVLYCAVGFRSSRVAAELTRHWPSIFNLEGSIFEWVNQGRPVFKNDLPTNDLHTFGKAWSGLVKPVADR